MKVEVKRKPTQIENGSIYLDSSGGRHKLRVVTPCGQKVVTIDGDDVKVIEQAAFDPPGGMTKVRITGFEVEEV